MKAILIAAVLLVVLALATDLVLDTRFAMPSSDRNTVAGTVRLDPGMRSDIEADGENNE